MFYGGLAGVGIVLIAAIVVGIALRFGGSRLRAQLNEEYGKRQK
jgi:hypothetical protein